ncbi:hypothetical protein JAAARDRAFT_36055 [Jaapia argillacea MUCL 33604]|uniref:Uncharacterized protein n=1 Tax=Jaapia argillacea MUCL 33604 TaxID=933084 RepID=A0A067PRV7_9AGAM|nr:hypothetical protein JAAARDRAFT_36055 [Jaapia argillacea MUCL 33604]
MRAHLEDSIQDLARQIRRFLGEERYPTNHSKLDNLRQVHNLRRWEPPEDPSTPSYVNPVGNIPSIIRKSTSLAMKTGEIRIFPEIR